MPWWSGAVFNYIKQVEPNYVVLKARAVSGVRLNQWNHHSIDTAKHPYLLDSKYWRQSPFTFFVFCFFSTKEGGLSPGNGKMSFPDFYPGECSADGRLCSFLSREGTRIFREQQEDSVHDDGVLKQGDAYFRG